MDVIGMTNLPEAKLAREAEICYATLALVTDYDVWHEGEEDVTVDVVVKALMENVEKAKRIIRGAICLISKERSCKCSTALKDALITKKRFIPDERLEELKLLVGKYL
jgi:5'-methylthioadenosine phosphorylase